MPDDMTDEQFACIRALVNFARIAGERTTKASLRTRMIADGWTDEQIKEAIKAVKEANNASGT